MNRMWVLWGLAFTIGLLVEAAVQSVPGGIELGTGWVYRAVVEDLFRGVTRTTTVTFLGVGEPQGRQAVVVITAREWGTVLNVYLVPPGPDPLTAWIGPDLVVLRWPNVLDHVPELRGARPPLEGFVFPAVPMEELNWSLSFQMRLGGSAVERGEIRLALGPHGEVTVPAGMYAGLYSTTYFANWGTISHQGRAWWPREEGTAGPVWIPVRAEGTVGATVQYSWELVERRVLDAEELRALLRDALQATEKENPVQAREAREALRSVGFDL